jgi:hypothetical protein
MAHTAHGYSIEQVSGPRNEGINQKLNLGGTSPGFAGEIFACKPGCPHTVTTSTYPTYAEAEAAVERLLLVLDRHVVVEA